jgi:hypothetical protein
LFVLYHPETRPAFDLFVCAPPYHHTDRHRQTSITSSITAAVYSSRSPAVSTISQCTLTTVPYPPRRRARPVQRKKSKRRDLCVCVHKLYLIFTHPDPSSSDRVGHRPARYRRDRYGSVLIIDIFPSSTPPIRRYRYRSSYTYVRRDYHTPKGSHSPGHALRIRCFPIPPSQSPPLKLARQHRHFGRGRSTYPYHHHIRLHKWLLPWSAARGRGTGRVPRRARNPTRRPPRPAPRLRVCAGIGPRMGEYTAQ